METKTIETYNFSNKYGDITFEPKILKGVLTNITTIDLSKNKTSVKHLNWNKDEKNY